MELENKSFKLFTRISPAWLANYVLKDKWLYPKHISLIDKLLLKISLRHIKKIIINMPPRHGKSELISKFFPAWYLGNFPQHRIILTSYEAQFAASFGRKVKDILTEYGMDLFNIKINPASNSASRFNILQYDGGMDCVGAGGPITGKGADVLIIDDPVKNDTESNSITFRNNIWDWFNATAYTRLEPNGVIIIVMTRWNEDDLCGRIFKYHNTISINDYSINDKIPDDTWIVVNLPAIAIEDDIIGRKADDVLWQNRFPKSKILEIKQTLGSYWFSALYQQSPNPIGGGIFKRKYFQYFRVSNDFYYLNEFADNQKIVSKIDCKIYAVMDLASTLKETSDFTVIIVFALSPDSDVLILEVIRERFEGADHLNLLFQIDNKWNPISIGIENVQYQSSLIQNALRKGLKIIELKPDKEKVMRALPMQAWLEAGKVFFKIDAPWLDIFEEELLLFPKASHDDQVDAFAYIDRLIPKYSNLAIGSSSYFQSINNKISNAFIDEF